MAAEMNQEAVEKLLAEYAKLVVVNDKNAKRAEENAKLAEENAKLAEENAKRAEKNEKRAEESEKRAEENAKSSFLNALRGMSASSSSESSSGADLTRRGVPEAIHNGRDLLSEIDVDETLLLKSWKSLRDVFLRGGEAYTPPASHEAVKETKHVQPVLWTALRVAATMAALHGARHLRVWKEATPEDEIPCANFKPDFTVTHTDEAQAAVSNCLMLFEVKLPSNLAKAIMQVGAYCRRVIRVLVNEALARGDPVDTLSAMGAGTDGNSIVFVIMHSGAPPNGQSWEGCIPCPWEVGVKEELFPECDFRALPILLPDKPTNGFKQLLRVFCATDAQLGATGSRLPLPKVTLRNKADDSELCLNLGARLGSGGGSDVYSVVVNGEKKEEKENEKEGVEKEEKEQETSQVLKLARCASTANVNAFSTEVECLQAFASENCKHLPRLLSEMSRPLSCFSQALTATATTSPVLKPTASETKCPALLLSPEGISVPVQLDNFIQSRPQQASRLDFADKMLSDILTALRSSHKMGWMHCDLRLKNIVYVHNIGFVVVDWGLACKKGDQCKGRGVPEYAASSTFASCKAHPTHDLEAAIYTWLSVVYGGNRCEAPWAGATMTVNDVLINRQSWLDKQRSDKLVQRASTAIEALSKLREESNKGKTLDRLYVDAASFWDNL